MARIVEQIFVVKVSKLVRNDEDPDTIMPEETGAALEAFVTELAQDSGLVVEVSDAP